MMAFLTHLLEIFPKGEKGSMRRMQEKLIFEVVQANYSADYKSGYDAILQTIGGTD